MRIITHIQNQTLENAICEYIETHLPGVKHATFEKADAGDNILITDDPQKAQLEWLQHFPDETEPNLITVGNESEDDISDAIISIQSALLDIQRNQIETLQQENSTYNNLLTHTRKELSTFYHNINNPLTILSGNLQLLQLIGSSMEISPEIAQPIEDISGISERLENDLQQIVRLKERIEELQVQD